MAYGKIKADAIIYDNNGSDVEKTIASLANAAPTASPTFTGTPAAPTAAADTNTTQIATTAYVYNQLASATASKADLASPTFSGVPAAPTASAGTNSTQIATTAFVTAAIDPDTAKTDVAQTFTAAQRGQKVTASGTSFTLDLNAANNFQISPSGTYTVALSNLATAAVGQTGSIFITPSATAASGSFPTTMKFVGGAAGIALTGTSGSIDRIDYIVMDNTTVTCNFTANYVQ